MSYVDDLREYLQAVRRGQVGGVALDPAQRSRLEQALLAWFEGNAGAASPAEVEAAYRRWTQPDLFAAAIEALLDAVRGLAGFEPATVVESLHHALAWIIEAEEELRFELPASPWSGLRTSALQRAAEIVGIELLKHRRAGRPQPRSYARHLGLVRVEGPYAVLTTSGTLAIELPGQAIVHWFLALERAQSTGPGDPWRSDESLLRRLLAGPYWFDHHHEAFARLHERRELRAELAALRRLRAFGVLASDGSGRSSDSPEEGFELTHFGHAALTDLFGEPEPPLSLLARAVSEDQSVGPPVKLLAAVSRDVAAYTDAARHTRLIAHEIRNALVPVQVAFEHLWRRLSDGAVLVDVASYRETVLAGLGRMFRFVDESARIARLTASPPEPFDAHSAVGDAIDEVQADFQRGVAQEVRIAAERGAPLLVGHRDRFILALVNLLRNAVQANATAASITLVADEPEATDAGAGELTLHVDDDGEGIPLAHRRAIFEPGFSLREGGSGHGLALVREVIEGEMRGKVMCTDSPSGGTRFTLRIPCERMEAP